MKAILKFFLFLCVYEGCIASANASIPFLERHEEEPFKAALSAFKNLRTTHPKLQSLKENSPTTFISYAWGVSEQERTVHTLAANLRDAGINVLLDIWHNKGGTSTIQFARKIIDRTTDFVVLCGSQKLMEKLDEKNENDSVVRFEVLDMLGKRLTWGLAKRNIVPILLEGKHEEVLPDIFANTVSIGFQKREDYCMNCFSLLERLYKLEYNDLLLEKIKKDFNAHKTRLMRSPEINSALDVRPKKVKDTPAMISMIETDEQKNSPQSQFSLWPFQFSLWTLLGAKETNDTPKALPLSQPPQKVTNKALPLSQPPQKVTNKDIFDALKKVKQESLSIEDFAALLKSDPSLSSLYLSGSLCRPTISPEDVMALAQALKGNTSLNKLDLGFNDIGDKGGKALAQALQGNTSLNKLDLGFNNIGDEGGKALAQALQGNTSLKLLNLECNNIGDEGGKALAQALKGNTSLTVLDLQHNKIGVEGGKALAQALQGNTSLNKLNLSWNNIGEEGKGILQKLKQNNPTLTIYF